MFVYTKYYTKKRFSFPNNTKIYKPKFFIGTILDEIKIEIIENINQTDIENLTKEIISEKTNLSHIYTDEIKFINNEKKNLSYIYTNKNIDLFFIAMEKNIPLIDNIKILNVNKNSLIHIPKLIREIVDEKRVLLCFEKENFESFIEGYKKINLNVPKVFSCYADDLRKNGYANLSQWIQENPQDNIYLWKKIPLFYTNVDGKKERVIIEGKTSPFAVPQEIAKEKKNGKDFFKIKYKEYLETIFNKGIVSIETLSGKNLACWCNENCLCSLIKDIYIEKSVEKLIY